MVRPTPLTKSDVQILVEYCIAEMNIDIQNLPANKKTKYLPTEFSNPDWSIQDTGWDNVVDRINKAYTKVYQQA